VSDGFHLNPPADCRQNLKEIDMLGWALAFFIVAVIAAVFGFGGIAAGAATIAKVLFFVFLVLFLLSLVGGVVRRGSRAAERV
jgi:uncharacterized membrane protein YtjA (UPF0391 family)